MQFPMIVVLLAENCKHQHRTMTTPGKGHDDSQIEAFNGGAQDKRNDNWLADGRNEGKGNG